MGTFLPIDKDALSFITIVGLTNSTHKLAISNLFRDLKKFNLYTKMNAVYPFIGGTSDTHKWNLMNPVDTNAGFRLGFTTGFTHSSTGIKGNGSTDFANTYLNNNTVMNLNSAHLSVYSRTQEADSTSVDIGVYNFSSAQQLFLSTRYLGDFIFPVMNTGANTANAYQGDDDASGFFIGNRNSSTEIGVFKNDIKLSAISTTATSKINGDIFLCARCRADVSTASLNSDRELAFASIGDGLTDEDASNLNRTVQRYQTLLGRAINYDVTTYDSDAYNFITAATITRQLDRYAINELVLDLKEAGIWSATTAIYPFIGGNSTSHRFNLKDPRDDDAAYRLTFAGGVTHTNYGVKFNGTSGWANTFLPNSGITQNSIHLGVYSRTAGNTGFDISGDVSPRTQLILQYTNGNTYYDLNNTTANTSLINLATTATGFYVSNRTASNAYKLFRRGISVATDTDATSAPDGTNFNIARLTNNTAFSSRQYAFATLGTSLTDTQLDDYNTIVEMFQVRLGRSMITLSN